MGGSGGGGGAIFNKNRTPAKLANEIRRAEERAADQAFRAELSRELSQLLVSYNDRDVEMLGKRLDDILGLLASELETELATLFGGSVAKHTYVDGISDVDALLIVSNTELIDSKPPDILKYIADVLGGGIKDATVTTGRIAVTVDYNDGMQLQLLPAIRSATGLRVPSWEPETWSTIDPEAFTAALTRRNEECAGKLIPTIKLAKAINATYPENIQLTGYHIEAIAIDAFRGYEGTRDLASMLPVLFDKARERVLSPIRDRTGQSIHVDEYLGDESSQARQQISDRLTRTMRRMRNASATKSLNDWMSFFGE